MRSSSKVIALVGKVGHGKTLLVNKLTGERFPSHSGSKSVTRTLQWGYTRNRDILVVDTPGFYGSEDVAAHIAGQKAALEGTMLSGVYVVIKYGRADDMAEALNRQIDFIGNEDIRIIITHEDVASLEYGYSARDTKETLSRKLELPAKNIFITGKHTPDDCVENFIWSSLHEPRNFSVADDQVAVMSSIVVASRRFNKDIEAVYAKLAAASTACVTWTSNGKNYESDVAITSIQNSTSEMVANTKDDIFRRSTDLNQEQQNLIYGKAGFALSLRLREFMTATNKLLSWDVTNPSDARNVYRKCNYCGAVFNKTEGCDGETICGAVPRETRRDRHGLRTGFSYMINGWQVVYYWNGLMCQFGQARSYLCAVRSFTIGGGKNHTRRPSSVIESGCGAQISWSTMLPVEPEELQALGTVELQHPGVIENSSKKSFDANISRHLASNRNIMNAALAHGN